MDQSLLVSRGAQSVKPSRYKPIWTDRFFTGYFTNRSPFRSPLSAFYADGWQLGKTDTIIDGLNVEVSPRLTLIRRPGTQFYCSVPFTDTVLGYYSFHDSQGNIHLIVDTNLRVLLFTTTSLTLLHTKVSGAQQSHFYGLGTTLYWDDGVQNLAYNFADGVLRQQGITAPASAPTTAIKAGAGSELSLHGAQFNGSSAYVSTGNSLTLGTSTTANSNSMECWINTTTPNEPLISFESNSTGSSTNVWQLLSLDNSGNLQVQFWDNTNSVMTSADTGVKLNDGKWHWVSVNTHYYPTATVATGITSGVPVARSITGTTRLTPDPVIFTPYLYSTTPTVSYSGAPTRLLIVVWIDGELVGEYTPTYTGQSGTRTGYWRLGNASAVNGYTGTAWYSGLMAFAGVNSTTTSNNQTGRFNDLVLGTLAQFQATLAPNLTNSWALEEASGTTAADSVGGDTGTYQGTFTLNQQAYLAYTSYGASVAYSVGQYVVDSNGNLQECVGAGTSGSSVPVWNTTLNAITYDNTVAWLNVGPASITLSTSQGAAWCYSYVNAYGNFSTASPLTSYTGPQTSISVALSGPVSSDAQVKYVAIFRTADGGSIPYLVGTVPNSGVNGKWSFTDATPDADLNILIAAPQASANNPPPTGARALTYNQGRMWCAVGGVLYASGGPDTLVGNGSECWPPGNTWTFPGTITRLVATTSGLFVFTNSSVYLLAGGPSISNFYPQNMLEKVGLTGYNALDFNGSRITLFTADRQLLSLDTSVGVVDLGFPIGDKIAALNPSSVYVVEHHNGLDNGIFLGDGSTGWYRCVPQQPPDYQITGPVWSPRALINGGLSGPIASLETTPGVYQLIVTITNSLGQSFIGNRDSTYGTFTDATGYYDAYFTVGSIMLASPGELAELAFLTADFIRTGSSPTISVLLDEVSGTFSSLSGYVVSDPPKLYGQSGHPTSLYANRYYFRQTVGGSQPPPAVCRHLQIKCDFGNDTVMNEILSTTLYGAVLVEGD